MYTSTLLSAITLSLLSTLAASTPIAANTPASKAATPPAPAVVSATCLGAADAQYNMTIPMDGQFHFTGSVLSVSHIDISGGAPCGFWGIDGAQVTFSAAGGQDVGPPQTIVGAACGTPPAGSQWTW